MGPLLPLQTVCPALCHLGISCGNVYTECNGLSHPSRSNQHDGGRHGQKAHPTWLRRWSVSHSCTLRQTFRPSRIRDTGPPLTRDISTAHNPQSTCTSTGAGRALGLPQWASVFAGLLLTRTVNYQRPQSVPFRTYAYTGPKRPAIEAQTLTINPLSVRLIHVWSRRCGGHLRCVAAT